MTEENAAYEVGQKESKAVLVIEQASPMALAQSFIASGGDIETLREMMVLQKEHEAYQAKKSFIAAMAEFKKEPIKILKDKSNKQYGSKYSSIGATTTPCLPRMGECGLSHKWDFDTQTDVKFLTGRCIVTHRDGHSDSVSMTCPIDTSGQKNPIQQIKSTRTYIKIETFTSLMGLTSSETDLDDDGTAAGIKYITEKQVSQITDMINSTEANEPAFLKWLNVESIELIPMNLFTRAMTGLKAKMKK